MKVLTKDEVRRTTEFLNEISFLKQISKIYMTRYEDGIYSFCIEATSITSEVSSVVKDGKIIIDFREDLWYTGLVRDKDIKHFLHLCAEENVPVEYCNRLVKALRKLLNIYRKGLSI